MYKLLQGDCLELIKKIPDKSIDLIATDPPYLISATNRNFIGIELDKNYFEIAKKRIINNQSNQKIL